MPKPFSPASITHLRGERRRANDCNCRRTVANLGSLLDQRDQPQNAKTVARSIDEYSLEEFGETPGRPSYQNTLRPTHPPFPPGQTLPSRTLRFLKTEVRAREQGSTFQGLGSRQSEETTSSYQTGQPDMRGTLLVSAICRGVEAASPLSHGFNKRCAANPKCGWARGEMPQGSLPQGDAVRPQSDYTQGVIKRLIVRYSQQLDAQRSRSPSLNFLPRSHS